MEFRCNLDEWKETSTLHFFGASGRTHCVDTTIANILEGRVSYVPEKESNHTEIHNDVKMSSTSLSNEVI